MGLGVCFGKRKKAEPTPDYKTKVKFQGASPDGIANNMEAPETLSTKRGFDVQSIQFSNFFDLRNDKALENSQNLQKSVAQRPTSSVSDDFLGQRPKTEQTARPNSVDLLVNREEVEFDDPDVDDDNDDDNNNNKNDNENEESESESEVSYVSRNTEKSEKSNKSNKSEAKKRKSLTERIKSAVSRNSKVKSTEINNNNNKNNNNKNSKKSDSAENKSSAITKTNTNINEEEENKDEHRNRVSKKRVGKHKVKKRVKVKRKKHRNLSNSENEQNGVKKEKKTKTKMTEEEIKEKMNNRENSEFDKRPARMTFDSINGDL